MGHKLQWQYWSSPHQPRFRDLCTSHLGSRALRIHPVLFLTHTEWHFFWFSTLHLYWQIWFLKYIARSVGKVVLPFKNIYFALMSWSGQLFPSYMIWLCKLWKIGDLIHTTPPFPYHFWSGMTLRILTVTQTNIPQNYHVPHKGAICKGKDRLTTTRFSVDFRGSNFITSSTFLGGTERKSRRRCGYVNWKKSQRIDIVTCLTPWKWK